MELLERDRELESLDSALVQATQGQGSFVVISGEAGIGKTELIHTFTQGLDGRVPVLWGGCDDLSTPRTLGPFRDMAIQVGGPLKELLASGAASGDILDAIFELLDGGRPASIAVVEDIHWADGATLDVLKFLGRRIDHASVLLLVTYRDDEVGPGHPARLVLGDLPSQSVHRLALETLSRNAVETLAEQHGRPIDELYAATGGNPFLVGEALAAPDLAATPAGLRDAVLARASRLSATGREVAELAAVVPGQVERSLLGDLGSTQAESLEECRRRGLLDYDESWVWYRHELVRGALRDSLGAERRRELNAAVLAVLIASGADVARIVHHAKEAGDPAAIARFAPAAARQASGAASHKESIEHYRLAAKYLDHLSAEDKAALLSEYAIECYLGNEVAEGLEISHHALALWREQGNAEREGITLRWQSRLHWWLGHGENAERTGQDAVAVLEALPDSSGLPMAYSNLAQLSMLAQDFRPAEEWSIKAIDAARARGDEATLSHALNNLGSARVRVGDLSGFGLLEESLDIALSNGFDDYVGRAYANLIWTALDYRDYAAAEGYLEDGLAFAIRRNLGGSVYYMTAERASLRLERGDWAGADEDVSWVVGRPEEPGITRMPALATRARLAVRRGDQDARQFIDDAWALAEPTGELQRIAPVAAARAELAWLDGDETAIRQAAEAAYALAVAVNQPWVTDELAFWMWRSGDQSIDLGRLETPFLMQVAGRWQDAAEYWRNIGAPYEQATALMDSEEAGDLLQSLELLDGLGAAPAASLVRKKMRDLGMRGIPRGPRTATRANPAGLTSRQQEVLSLVAEGMTNAEIAAAIFVSPKTVDHHVSAILAKLEVGSRHEAAELAATLGLAKTSSD